MSRGTKQLVTKLLDNCCSLVLRRGSLSKSFHHRSVSSAAIASSSELPLELDPRRKLRTAVLFLNHGEPRDASSAREFLQKRSSLFYRSPLFLSRPLTNIYWNIRGDKYIGDLMEQSGDLPSLSSQMEVRGALLQKTLNALIPEFGPFGLIEQHVASFPEDVQESIGIVFCAPFKRFYGSIDYKHEISASCVRTIEALNSRFAWRLGWFSSWDQWPYMGRRSVLSAIRQLRRQNRPNILLVPLPYTSRNLDTQVVLPRIVTEVNLKRAKAHQVELVQPEEQHPTLIQGLAEVVKNHLLHGRYVSGQFSQHCRWCYRSQCGHTKRLFGRPTFLRSQALSSISDEP
uniref:Uncharacterized protein n=1 Tax=Plectus sambesii TaxID=2011161 RepID=A0A914VY01_9BILA